MLQSDAQTLGDGVALLHRGVGQQHRKLLATQSSRHVFLAQQIPAQQVGQMNQYLVACGVPPGVIDPFEVVQIQHQEGRWGGAVRNMGDLGFEAGHESAPVGQARQGVGGGQPLQRTLAAAALGDVLRQPQPAQVIASGGAYLHHVDPHGGALCQRHFVSRVGTHGVQLIGGGQRIQNFRWHHGAQLGSITAHQLF